MEGLEEVGRFTDCQRRVGNVYCDGERRHRQVEPRTDSWIVRLVDTNR